MYTFKTRRFIVRATIEPDNDVDLSWDDTGEIAKGLNSGLYAAFNTTVTVETRNGQELGRDTICGSVYENPADFFSEHRGSRGKWGSYFADLVRGAISQARKHETERAEHANN